jgi:hypothetical protein
MPNVGLAQPASFLKSAIPATPRQAQVSVSQSAT